MGHPRPVPAQTMCLRHGVLWMTSEEIDAVAVREGSTEVLAFCRRFPKIRLALGDRPQEIRNAMGKIAIRVSMTGHRKRPLMLTTRIIRPGPRGSSLRRMPRRHVDVSSTLHFCSMVSAFVPVEFYDIRPARLELEGLACKRGDLLDLPFSAGEVTSLSCMHVVEHVGLGRYGDAIDPSGRPPGDCGAHASPGERGLVTVRGPGGPTHDSFQCTSDLQLRTDCIVLPKPARSAICAGGRQRHLHRQRRSERSPQPAIRLRLLVVREMILGLVFSKDRAMQLDATLSSFFRQAVDADLAQMMVLYRTSRIDIDPNTPSWERNIVGECSSCRKRNFDRSSSSC